MRRTLLVTLSLAVTLVAMAAAIVPASAETNYGNPVTADRPVPVPDTAHCSVTVMQHTFAASYYQPYVGTWSPPAGCPGPWSKVVLTLSGSVAGRQYDRISGIWIGGAEVMRTSTPEPDPAGISWQVQKDVTEYSPLFTANQSVQVQLDNIYDSTYTGAFDETLTLTFYEASQAAPAGAHPDQVIGVTNPVGTNTGEWSYLNSAGDAISSQVTFPPNLTRLDAEVYTSGHGCEEFWYGNQPDSYATPNGLCGGGPYREVDVYLDGTLAGEAMPFPTVFTGGWNPILWRPIPGVRAFDLTPYELDLTPFAGTLTDGRPHTVSVRVGNQEGYWLTDADLLAYTDPNSTQTTGAVTSYSAPALSEQDSYQANGTNAGVFTTTASHTLTVSGYVKSSAGQVTSTVAEKLGDQNVQQVNLNNFLENIQASATDDAATTTVAPDGTTSVTSLQQTFPFTGQSAYITHKSGPNSGQFNLPAHLDFSDVDSWSTTVNGTLQSWTKLDNEVIAAAKLEEGGTAGTSAVGSTSQDYDFSDSTGVCYNHYLSADQGYVTTDDMKPTC